MFLFPSEHQSVYVKERDAPTSLGSSAPAPCISPGTPLRSQQHHSLTKSTASLVFPNTSPNQG